MVEVDVGSEGVWGSGDTRTTILERCSFDASFCLNVPVSGSEKYMDHGTSVTIHT